MSVEKISATTPITNNLQAKVEEKKTTSTAEPDKKLSDNAKLMIGATLLAGTIAIGIIGHKNNWWRKAVREGENLSSSANHNPQPRTNPEPVQPHVDPESVQPHTNPIDSQTPPHTEPPQTPPQTPPHAEIIDEVKLPANIKNIKTVEAAAEEFNRVATRELQELPANKAIIEEALAERSKFIVDNPTTILDAEGIIYRVENSTITIMDKTGKPVQRIRFNMSQNEGWGKGLSLPPRPMLIEYINPETGKLTKIIESDFDAKIYSIRLFGDNESAIKEIFYSDEKKLIIKDYKKAGNIPDKVSVFNTDNNTMMSCVEYNAKTGYPNIAYSQGHIYTPRSDSSRYFDNVIESVSANFKTSVLDTLYGATGRGDIDLVMPRLTKSGYIIEKGNANCYSYDLTLLDFATHENKYSIKIEGDDIVLREFNPKTLKQIKVLFIEDGEVVANKFGKAPKEVLEEMKEIFADLTPNLYPESSTKLPELIQEFIAKLA